MTQAVELLDVERRIALFAQAITGSAYEVRAAETFTGDEVIVRHDHAMLSSKALFLPASIATNADRQMNRRMYRLLSLHQLGYREFGTFEFRLAIAAGHSPTLRTVSVRRTPSANPISTSSTRDSRCLR